MIQLKLNIVLSNKSFHFTSVKVKGYSQYKVHSFQFVFYKFYNSINAM